jgi:hypothetical protein
MIVPIYLFFNKMWRYFSEKPVDQGSEQFLCHFHGDAQCLFEKHQREGQCLSEGLPFRKTLFATAHKLIRAIFAMLQKRTYFMVNQIA